MCPGAFLGFAAPNPLVVVLCPLIFHRFPVSTISLLSVPLSKCMSQALYRFIHYLRGKGSVCFGLPLLLLYIGTFSVVLPSIN